MDSNLAHLSILLHLMSLDESLQTLRIYTDESSHVLLIYTGKIIIPVIANQTAKGEKFEACPFL